MVDGESGESKDCILIDCFREGERGRLSEDEEMKDGWVVQLLLSDQRRRTGS